MIKSVRKYQAEDGSLFDDISEARQHDAKKTAMDGIRKALANINNGASYGNLPVDILCHPERIAPLRDALNKMLDVHRRYSKEK